MSNKNTQYMRDRLAPYLLISPFLISFLLFFLVPALISLVLSFFRYRGYGTPTFVGFHNYITTLQYATFWRLVKNTMFYWIAHAVIMMPISFGLAVLVKSPSVKHKRIIKPILFLPQIVAIVAAALLFQSFFGGEYGVLNSILGTNIPWLQDMRLARWVVVVTLIWRGTGYWFVIFLAGLTGIGDEVLNAAVIDGANAWQRLTRIIIPLMRNSFIFAFVVDGIVTLRIFAEPNILGGRGGALAPQGMAPVVNMVMQGLRVGRYGQASAVGWLLFLLIGIVTFIQFRVLELGREAR